MRDLFLRLKHLHLSLFIITSPLFRSSITL
nr:MAG TPA: hypothetical protein [Bacteriophage sp.]